ncbi:MAG: GNAT family N-acetyltransferase [Nocardioides sp.]
MARTARLPQTIRTDRLLLTPLRPGDAEEMVLVLASPRLYDVIGGAPPTVEELRVRYAAQARGESPDGSEEWLNWVVRHTDGTPVGTLQATVDRRDGRADVAWVIGADWQGRGYAAEAAAAMVTALIGAGVSWVTAHIHPTHHASQAVARSCRLTPTPEHHDGEQRWEWRRSAGPAG